MHHQLPSPSTCQQVSVLQSRDLVAGLGAAPRHLLATCLALFEDGTLQQRLSERIDALGKRWSSRGHRGQEEGDAAAMPSPVASLQQGVIDWQQAPVPDDDLRLLLWMRLREAFGLDASTFGSLRSAGTAADDLVATLLASLQPGLLDKAKAGLGLETRTAPDSLDALARQTLDEMLAQVMQGDDAAHATARQALVADVRQRVSQLDPAVRAQLLEAIGARELNDDAIRTILLTGGGLASLGTAVSVAGFSAYILAAQASAFIPLVSGPALVSFVAVLSNPVTIVLATLGTGWWAARSANQKIQAAIAMRVIALLALNGLTAGNAENLPHTVCITSFLPHRPIRRSRSFSRGIWWPDWGRRRATCWPLAWPCLKMEPCSSACRSASMPWGKGGHPEATVGRRRVMQPSCRLPWLRCSRA